MVTIGIAGGSPRQVPASDRRRRRRRHGDARRTAVGGTTPSATSACSPTRIHANSLAISVGRRPRPLAAVALVTVARRRRSGSSGSVGAGGITIQATGNHSAEVDAVNNAIGAIAIWATVAIARNERWVLATLSSTASMSSTGAVLVAADSHDTADANTPGGGGGGISISVMVPIASVSGATRARLDGDITGSTSIEVRATGENVVTATALVVGLSVIGISGAVANAELEDTGDVEAIVDAASSLTGSGLVMHHSGRATRSPPPRRSVRWASPLSVAIAVASDNGACSPGSAAT
jgi:hypothetical protein